ncbi:MAG: TlpA family protein disulfide reductase [Anaerolineae bacterium]|nr:TlpA family protein disulfide reductase [Anaerolineae bacterium]
MQQEQKQFTVTTAVLIGALVLIMGACNQLPTLGDLLGSTIRDASGRPTQARVGELAPEIDLPTVTGERIVLSQLVGKPVVVNFWATWCPPCRAEFPAFVRKYKQYQDQGLVIIGVNTQDTNSDEGIRTFMQNTLVNFPIVRDPTERVTRAYNVRGLPTTVFIDRQGIIREIIVGGPLDDTQLDEKIAKIK